MFSSRFGLLNPIEYLLSRNYNCQFHLDFSFLKNPHAFSKYIYYYSQFYILNSINEFWISIRLINSAVITNKLNFSKLEDSKAPLGFLPFLKFSTSINFHSNYSNYLNLINFNFLSKRKIYSNISYSIYLNSFPNRFLVDTIDGLNIFAALPSYFFMPKFKNSIFSFLSSFFLNSFKSLSYSFLISFSKKKLY